MGTSSIPNTTTNLDQRKLLYQKYGYDINKLIRAHERLELNLAENGDDSDEYNIIDEKSDKLDYQLLIKGNEGGVLDPVASKQGKTRAKRSRRRRRADQGFRNFTKVSRSFRDQEDSPKRLETSSAWLLKDVLKYIKYRSTRLDPYITKYFTPKAIAPSSALPPKSFVLRLVEFGDLTCKGDITAILSDATHKLCAIFPSKSIFDNIANNGALPLQDPYSINNYISISKSNLKFVLHEFIKSHFKSQLNYIDSKVRYCVLQVLEYKFMYSVEFLMSSRVEGAPPLEKIVNNNGSQYEVYDYEDFELSGGGGGGVRNGGGGIGIGMDIGGAGGGLPKFDKTALKLVYNNEFYRKLCII